VEKAALGVQEIKSSLQSSNKAKEERGRKKSQSASQFPYGGMQGVPKCCSDPRSDPQLSCQAAAPPPEAQFFLLPRSLSSQSRSHQCTSQSAGVSLLSLSNDTNEEQDRNLRSGSENTRHDEVQANLA